MRNCILRPFFSIGPGQRETDRRQRIPPPGISVKPPTFGIMSRSFIPLPSMRFGGHRPPGGGAAGSGAGVRAGSNPSGAAKSSFSGCFGQEQIILSAAPVFFTTDASGSGVADGVSSSRRDSAAAIGFSAVFTYTTIPCPVVTGGGRYLHRYKFGPLWNESDRPLFSSATAYPLSACPDCRSFGSIRVDRKSTRLNSSHMPKSRMPSSA